MHLVWIRVVWDVGCDHVQCEGGEETEESKGEVILKLEQVEAQQEIFQENAEKGFLK